MAQSSVMMTAISERELTFKDRALPNAVKGLPVIRLDPCSKIPTDKAWQEIATTSIDQILAWSSETPQANCGCVAKENGFLFFETDEPGVIERYEKETGQKFPKTYTVQSRPGRFHFYFRQTVSTKNMGQISQKILGFGSVRQHDAYVVSANSIHPDTGLPYRLVNDSPIVEMPDALVAWLISQKKKDQKSQSPNGGDFVVVEGGRNAWLTSQAGKLRHDGLEQDEIESALLRLNEKHCRPPLPESEVKTIAWSVSRYSTDVAPKLTINGAIPGTPAPAPTADPTQTPAAPLNLADFVNDPAKPAEARVWKYRDYIPAGSFGVLWAGAEKAEKSLFALRHAMHEACGKDWLNFRCVVGPQRVFYFDAENSKWDLADRWNEIVSEFTHQEQELIKANLKILRGDDMRQAGVPFEWTARLTWQEIAKLAWDHKATSVYLDCLYQLHSLPAYDNERLKEALDFFKSCFEGATLYILHHTGRVSEEAMLKKDPPTLRTIGSRKWSSKIFGGAVPKKWANLVICQEMLTIRNKQGEVENEVIDFQFYGRSCDDSVLYTFEKDYSDDKKFKRNLVRVLSTKAIEALSKLKSSGVTSWPQKFDIARTLGSTDGRTYKVVSELIAFGYLLVSDDVKDKTVRLRRAEDVQLALDMAQDSVAVRENVAEWLRNLLGRGAGFQMKLVKTAAEALGKNWETVRREKRRMGIVEYKNDTGEECWKMPFDPEDDESIPF